MLDILCSISCESVTNVDSKGFDQTAWICSLVWSIIVCLRDKDQFCMPPFILEGTFPVEGLIRVTNIMAPGKASIQINIFHICVLKHMLWVLIRSASMRHF